MVSLTCEQLVGIESAVTIEVIPDMADVSPLSNLDDDEFEVEALKFNLDEIRKAHVTDEYDDDSALIVRRGFSLPLKFELNKNLKKIDLSVSEVELL